MGTGTGTGTGTPMGTGTATGTGMTTGAGTGTGTAGNATGPGPPAGTGCPQATLVVHVIGLGGQNEESWQVGIRSLGTCLQEPPGERRGVEETSAYTGTAWFTLLPGHCEVSLLNAPQRCTSGPYEQLDGVGINDGVAQRKPGTRSYARTSA